MGKPLGSIVLSAVVGAVVSVFVLKLLGVDTNPAVIGGAVGGAVGSSVHYYSTKKDAGAGADAEASKN